MLNTCKSWGGSGQLLPHRRTGALAHLTERLRDLMVITKLLTVFDVYDDEEKAVASFSGEILRVIEPQPVFA